MSSPPIEDFNQISDLERPFYGEIDFSRVFDNFDPVNLDTGSVANVNVLALINGDPARIDSLFPNGYPGPVFPFPDANNPQVFNEWIHLIQGKLDANPPIPGILGKSQVEINDDDVALMENFIGAMVFYLENGFIAPDPFGGDGLNTVFFTPEIARQLDLILKTLDAAGWRELPAGKLTTGNIPPLNVEVLKRWHNIAENHNTFQTLADMVGFIPPEPIIDQETIGFAGESLQRMLEIGYVNRGTEIIFEDMEVLRDRQTIAKEALTILTQIQNLHNQVIPDFIGDDPSQILVSLQEVSGTLPTPIDPPDGFPDVLPPKGSFVFDPVLGFSASLETWLTFRGSGANDANNDGYSDKDFGENWQRILDNFFQPLSVDVKPQFDGQSSEEASGNFLTDFVRLADELADVIGDLQDSRLDQAIEAAKANNEKFKNDPARIVNIPNSLDDLILQPLDPQSPKVLPGAFANDTNFFRPFILSENQGNLEDSLNVVLADMRKDYDPSDPADPSDAAQEASDFQLWIVDNWPNKNLGLDGIDNRSEVQNNLRTGVTAASNLNDELKEELRKTLFIFEEFYKSASALLAKITQIIEKIAGNAGR